MGFSKACLAAAVFGIAAGGAAHAQDTKIFQFALQNGMQVLVVPDHRAPVVTQMVLYRVGATDDPPGLSGLAHFFEHMMFRGTPAYPGDRFAQTVARNGGLDNAFTTHDYTVFYEQIARDRLKLVMSLDADRMANLDLSDDSVRTERDVVLEERRMRIENDPQSQMLEQLEAALHLSHPYGRPVMGWSDEIRHIGRMEAQNFYGAHYAPNNAILVVAGDVTPQEVRADAEAEYGKLSVRPTSVRAEFAQPPRLAETRMTISSENARVPLFIRVYRVPSYAEAKPGEAEALETLAQLLGGDATSALYRELVVKRKLATDAGATYSGYVRDAADFEVYAIPRPGVRLDTLERSIDDILRGFAVTRPRVADLERAKTQLVADAVYRHDSQYSMASAYGQALAVGLTTDDITEWPDRIRAVSADSVERTTANDLVKREAVTGYLLPSAGH